MAAVFPSRRGGRRRPARSVRASLCACAAGTGVALLVLSLTDLAGAEVAPASRMKGPPLAGERRTTAVPGTDEGSLVERVVLGSIRLFQEWLSPIDGPRCNFSPTCSAFGYQAVQEHGVLYGVVLTADRLMRCHSFLQPDAGADRVPDGRLLDPVAGNLLTRP